MYQNSETSQTKKTQSRYSQNIGKSTILGPILSLKTTPREVLGVPSLKKQPLEALNHCPGGARCSPRAPRGAKKQPQRLSVKAFGLPGEALGRVWDTPMGNLGAKSDPKLDKFAASCFETAFLKFFS